MLCTRIFRAMIAKQTALEGTLSAFWTRVTAICEELGSYIGALGSSFWTMQ